MLNDCWASVFANFDVRPIPDEYLPVGPGRIVVIGNYVGAARRTRLPLHAAFAHILRIEDGRVTELVQITDTGRWRDALGRVGS
jgi:2-(1,2-epoxy-1,2-dihydrophenyl)acetyl-CoA isomerase